MSKHTPWPYLKYRVLIQRGLRPTLTARATAEGRSWFVDIVELPRVFTEAHSYDEIEPMARDVIGLMLEVDPNGFELTVAVIEPAPEPGTLR